MRGCDKKSEIIKHELTESASPKRPRNCGVYAMHLKLNQVFKCRSRRMCIKRICCTHYARTNRVLRAQLGKVHSSNLTRPINPVPAAPVTTTTGVERMDAAFCGGERESESIFLTPPNRRRVLSSRLSQGHGAVNARALPDFRAVASRRVCFGIIIMSYASV